MKSPMSISGNSEPFYPRRLELNPILVSQNADVWVLKNINAQLVRNTREATGIEPDLADGWAISEDGKIYTFTLRDGAMFSDGNPLKASDVKFSIERGAQASPYEQADHNRT